MSLIAVCLVQKALSRTKECSAIHDLLAHLLENGAGRTVLSPPCFCDWGRRRGCQSAACWADGAREGTPMNGGGELFAGEAESVSGQAVHEGMARHSSRVTE